MNITKATDFGTLSSFGIKEPPSSFLALASDFGTLSSFGIKEPNVDNYN